jgi:hypothetical protein
MLSNTIPYWKGFGRVNGDVTLYATWSDRLLHGGVPYKDFLVVYPPGIVPLLALPHSSQNMYVAEFVAIALLADLGTLLLLSRRGRHPRGALCWLIGLPLLGPLAWGRLDVFVALALVGALVAYEESKFARLGACLAFAGLIKLWPFALVILLLPLLDRRARMRVTGAACASAAVGVVPLLLLGGWSGLWQTVSIETHRGVELEALPAVPLHIERALGGAWRLDQRFGSLDLVTSLSGATRTVSSALLAAAVLAIFAWALRDRGIHLEPVHIALLLVAAILIFNRVLSPQYLLWLLATVALAVDRASDPARLMAWTALALVATQVVFPFKFAAVGVGTTMGVLVVFVHALVLLAVAAIIMREVLSKTGSPHRRRASEAAPEFESACRPAMVHATGEERT